MDTKAGTAGCSRPSRSTRSSSIGPERCGSCAHEFVEADRVDAAEPSRRQVAELPPIAVTVTEHRLHRVCCPECAAVTAAEPPAGSRWAFGPRLQAAVVTLAVRNRVSRRDATELARELFGVELATGTVDAIVQRAGEALAAPHTRLEQEIKRSRVVNIDETGWKTGGDGGCSGARPGASLWRRCRTSPGCRRRPRTRPARTSCPRTPVRQGSW